MRQVNACNENMFETESGGFENRCQICHHVSGLALDSVGQWGVLVARQIWHLTGNKDPAVGLDRMAEGCDRAWRASGHPKI